MRGNIRLREFVQSIMDSTKRRATQWSGQINGSENAKVASDGLDFGFGRSRADLSLLLLFSLTGRFLTRTGSRLRYGIRRPLVFRTFSDDHAGARSRQ